MVMATEDESFIVVAGDGTEMEVEWGDIEPAEPPEPEKPKVLTRNDLPLVNLYVFGKEVRYWSVCHVVTQADASKYLALFQQGKNFTVVSGSTVEVYNSSLLRKISVEFNDGTPPPVDGEHPLQGLYDIEAEEERARFKREMAYYDSRIGLF